MTAYYNDNDPYVAAWLRNLAAAGHLPPGDVDERSIEEVQPDDLKGYDQCHFFAGIGGWPLALRMAGVPDDWPVWTGSCPCQPFSSAGQRKGSADERHLWPAFYRLIAERNPAIIFGEQVASKDGREWLAAVRLDLESLGYACGAADLPAAGIGAPHIRGRLFWVAHAESGEGGSTYDLRQGQSDAGVGSPIDRLAHAECCGTGRPSGQPGAIFSSTPDERTGQNDFEPRSDGPHGGLAHAERAERRQNSYERGEAREQLLLRRPQDTGGLGVHCPTDGLADSDRSGGQGSTQSERGGNGGQPQERRQQPRHNGATDGLGNATVSGLEGYGRPEQHPGRRVSGPAGIVDWRDIRYTPCADGKYRPIPLEPSLFPLADGLPGRVGRLRAYGNAIVPNVAAVFIRAVFDAIADAP